ncbi:uncharacterized protein LOC143456429 [Clavelina lepadiformis]|uniref:Alternative oxidase n=1 Tax=Clavelina lepadiformis TaxID=159417 RepID=A0ABP0H165_CLALP
MLIVGRMALSSPASVSRTLLQNSHGNYHEIKTMLYSSFHLPTTCQAMGTRWLHSSNSLYTKIDKEKQVGDKHDDASHPVPNLQFEKLPHFRERLIAEDDITLPQKETKIAKQDTEIHPDILEARSIQDGGYRLPHPIWSNEEVESVKVTHRPPQTKVDKMAFYTVKALRQSFDVFSGYSLGKWRGSLDEKQWIKRIMFLETIAGVPGMVGAMVRHLISLRRFKRDQGWIHTLLEEAENERMHLMTAMRIANPGFIMKAAVVGAQGVFVVAFSLAYFISPRFCHRFVGYLEEQAVVTYTDCLAAIDTGELKMWSRMKAPEIAVEYWKLKDDAMMRDVILAIRADEAHHRTVNHELSNRKPDEPNPYPPGE